MSATPTYTIDQKDIFSVVQCHLGTGLPYYKARSEAYLQTVFKNNPQIVLIQGVSPDSYVLMSALQNSGHLAIGEYRKSVFESTPSINMTWVSNDIQVLSTRRVKIETNDAEGNIRALAPDCIVTTIYHRGRMMDIYNFESIDGVFHSEARMVASSIVNRDAYLLKTRKHDHLESLLLLGASMHADSGDQSVQYLKGYLTRSGYAPSGWLDVWEELRTDTSYDRSATQRLEAAALFNDDLILPQFMKAKRHSYFFVYNDVFGRVGTPIGIERIGMESTDDGIPFSDTFGLSMNLFMPVYNKFSTEGTRYVGTVDGIQEGSDN